MNENEVLTTLPCLCSCTDWRADRLKKIVGAFYLRLLAGEQIKPPPLAEVLRGCCHNCEQYNIGERDPNSVTFVVPRHRGVPR
jgi:hypothetical protein